MRTFESDLESTDRRISKLFKHLLPRVKIIILVALALSATCGRTEKVLPVINIHAKRYEFTPAQVTLTVGVPARLVFVADDVAHGISVPGFFFDLDIIPGTPTTVVITPSRVGNFSGECSHYCGAGHRGMKFVIHVREQKK